MGFSPFTYWQRGRKVNKPLTRPKKGDKRHFVLQCIEHGDFEPSPWGDMIEEEYEMLNEEIEEYKEKNPRSSQETIEYFKRQREWVYSKRIKKLREAHTNYEIARSDRLVDLMVKCFGSPVVETVMQHGFDGDARDFYDTCVKYTKNFNLWDNPEKNNQYEWNWGKDW